MSYGDDRIRTTFNPSGIPEVHYFKDKAAEVIDKLEGMRGDRDTNEYSPEKQRLISLAQTGYEQACMWAVKAATTGE